jgi:chondroitin sulfate proteoglycan 4
MFNAHLVMYYDVISTLYFSILSSVCQSCCSLCRFVYRYVVVKQPAHGALLHRGNNVTVGQSFYQDDVNAGQLIYRHDHSEQINDSIGLTVGIDSSQQLPQIQSQPVPSPLPKATFTLNISIVPTNDQMFKVITDDPTVEVVQGFSVKITRRQLLTEDPDTPPSGILYEIMTSPSNGHLEFDDTPGLPLRMFTQKNVDENKVTFFHDGSNEPGNFYFRVSDTFHHPWYKTFIVKVLPLSLELNAIQNLMIDQSQSSALLSDKNLPVRTNGDLHRIAYNITKPPRSGLIYMNGSEVCAQFNIGGHRK